MRLRHLLRLGLAAGLVFVCTVGPAAGQGRGFRFDPKQMFDNYAKGRPFFLITDYPADRREPLVQFAKERGIAGGRMTFEQYQAYLESRRKAFSKGGPSGAGAPGAGAPAKPGATAAPAASPLDPAEAEFKRRDTNGDGKLNADEMPGWLRRDLATWDKNRDSLIDLTEFRAVFAAREQQKGRKDTRTAPITITIDLDELDSRPAVYRARSLPKDLPGWFKELDVDQDGQIALYEWRQAGKSLAEFRSWDRNDDGFITIDEALRQHRLGRTEPPRPGSPGVSGETGGRPVGWAARPAGGGMMRKKSGN